MTPRLAVSLSADQMTPPDPKPAAPDSTGSEIISDRLLVERTQAGDPTAFDELVRRYQPKLLGMLYNMISNHSDAWDLAMETFEKAFKEHPYLPPRCRVLHLALSDWLQSHH